MRAKRRISARSVLTPALLCLATAAPAQATFHFMQIDRVIGGVNGDATAQAIQLRMRVAEQELVSRAKLVAWDAAGQNPVVLIDFAEDVDNAQLGATVLAATQRFTRYTLPAAEPDFLLTNPIPEAYLAAGSITFENDESTLIVWRLCWGGAAYTGSTAGALTNDDDGDFGPPFADALPSADLRAVAAQIDAGALGSTNADDYALTATSAQFTNNSGDTFELAPLQCPDDPDNDADGDLVCGDEDNCPALANADQTDTDHDGSGDACDVCPDDDRTADDPTVCAEDPGDDGPGNDDPGNDDPGNDDSGGGTPGDDNTGGDGPDDGMTDTNGEPTPDDGTDDGGDNPGDTPGDNSNDGAGGDGGSVNAPGCGAGSATVIVPLFMFWSLARYRRGHTPRLLQR